MKKHILISVLTALLVSVGVYAGEVTDLSTTDASNTNTSYGFPENQAPSTVNDNLRAYQGMTARWYEDWRGTVVANTSGTANAIMVSPNRTITAYEDGFWMAFEATPTNTGSATVNFGPGAKTIKKNHDQNLASGDIEGGQKVIVVYNADEDVFQMLSATAAADVGFADPLTTRGDVIYRNSSNATARLAVGTTDSVLSSDGIDVSWSTAQSALGKQTIYIPSGAMRATVSNGAAGLTDLETTSGRPDISYMAFDSSADEHSQFSATFPKGWDEGTVTFIPYWSQAGMDAGGVVWLLQGVAVNDNDTIDVAYGTAITAADTAHETAEDLMIGAESGAATIAGAPAAGEIVFFRFGRDVSDALDTMAADALLIGVKILYTLDAANDD